jgi:hypothetical protein
MTPNSLAPALVLFEFAIAVIIMGYWIPWVGRLLAVYGLHGIRDRIYAAARIHPVARETELYRDLELLLTVLIHVVRDQPTSFSLAFLALLRRKPSFDTPPQKWKTYDRERDEIFKDRSGQMALDEMLHAALPIRRFVRVRALTANPALQLFGLGYLLVEFFRRPSVWISMSPSLTQVVSSSVTAAITVRDSSEKATRLWPFPASKLPKAA